MGCSCKVVHLAVCVQDLPHLVTTLTSIVINPGKGPQNSALRIGALMGLAYVLGVQPGSSSSSSSSWSLLSVLGNEGQRRGESQRQSQSQNQQLTKLAKDVLR